MLDRASIERLSRAPEKNAPALNVALAEEGELSDLLALARSPSLGADALRAIAARIEREGAELGLSAEAPEGEEPPLMELERLLVAHPNGHGDVRDHVLARHPRDPFFVLAAAVHPRATVSAIALAIDWPSASSVHDRLWLPLIDHENVPPLVMEEWARSDRTLRREAAARLARDASLLAMLSRDRSRRVRRAIAANRFAAAERERLAHEDSAPEVRARASSPLTAHGDPAAEAGAAFVTESARFAAALRAMTSGGVLAPDVTRALAGSAADLDDEGALIAAKVLPRGELGPLLDRILDQGPSSRRAMSLAAGLALRPASAGDVSEAEGEAEVIELVYDAVKALSRSASSEGRLTGKARLAVWAAEGLTRCEAVDRARLSEDLGRRAIAGDRMVLGRAAALDATLIPALAKQASSEEVPPALLTIAWSDASVPDATIVDLASRVARPKKRADDLPDDEIDLDPSQRSLDVLERVVLTTSLRANVSPRAALAAAALDARRVRYVLSAMPQWKGRLSGGKLARVLRQHAGALTAAQAESRARSARIEGWTERLLSELELSIALAVGHLTAAEVARRIEIGRQVVDDGVNLAVGTDARAAIEGADAARPILAWANAQRTARPSAFAVWLLLEKLDRERGPTLIASALDSLASSTPVFPACVSDAMALMEQRSPGRLDAVHAQSPRGRAALAGAMARAYRAVGGMRDERQG